MPNPPPSSSSSKESSESEGSRGSSKSSAPPNSPLLLQNSQLVEPLSTGTEEMAPNIWVSEARIKLVDYSYDEEEMVNEEDSRGEKEGPRKVLKAPWWWKWKILPLLGPLQSLQCWVLVLEQPAKGSAYHRRKSQRTMTPQETPAQGRHDPPSSRTEVVPL